MPTLYVISFAAKNVKHTTYLTWLKAVSESKRKKGSTNIQIYGEEALKAANHREINCD